MDLKLDGKLALVSGSTAGIGFAIASALANEGARVIINGRTKQRVDEAMKMIRRKADRRMRKGEVALEALPVDLATAAGTEEAVKRFPDVEVLVNCLGIYQQTPYEEIADEEWLRFFEMNVMTGVRLSRAYLAGMKKRNWGRIIFISSESGEQIPPDMVHYGVTKTAQIALARGIAETCAGTGVTSNAVLPGPTASEGLRTFVESMSKDGKSLEEMEGELFEKARPSSLLKRFAKPEEVAAMVTYLCSPVSSATNGAAVRVDGGIVRSPF